MYPFFLDLFLDLFFRKFMSRGYTKTRGLPSNVTKSRYNPMKGSKTKKRKSTTSSSKKKKRKTKTKTKIKVKIYKTPSMYRKIWSKHDDKILWKERDSNYEDLGQFFGRTKKGIMKRLSGLSNVKSVQYQRLFGKGHAYPDKTTHPCITKKFMNDVGSIKNMARLFGEPRNSPTKRGQKWVTKDDDILWKNRDANIEDLAMYFKRTTLSIEMRLLLLREKKLKRRKIVRCVFEIYCCLCVYIFV